jgi:N-acyl-D-amino-acid deacylase
MSVEAMMERYNRLFAFLPLLFIFFLAIPNQAPQLTFDILIKDAFIIDGTGNPWYIADIGIVDEKIAEIGRLKSSQAVKIIDATGLMVTPGFIDVHTHCDRGIAEVPTADNYILQGVTTVIGGNCGGHPYPLSDLYQTLVENGMSVNFGCLAGHNTLRKEVMGLEMRTPSEDEMERMKSLLDKEMKAGALGFSTGLSYLPGIYSDTEELVALASVLNQYGGIYASHIRDQGKKITTAIEEAIRVGEENDIRVQISHIKLAEDAVWGRIEKITRPIEKARKRGVEVFIDQYPYTATSSGFTSSLPSWCFEGGREKFLERLKSKKLYQEIRSYVIQRRLTSTRGIDKLETIRISRSRTSEYEGKNLREILIAQGKKPTVKNAADLIISIEKNGGTGGVFFQMDEKDVEDLMRLPYNIHASDGGIQVPGKGVPHPRNYGTFPRVIAHYVREKGVLSLEEAIKKMTSLPAQVFRLADRGILKKGLVADVTVFDYESFADKASFENPHQYSQGLYYVIVNGEIVVQNNTHTGKRPGKILYGPGARSGGKK